MNPMARSGALILAAGLSLVAGAARADSARFWPRTAQPAAPTSSSSTADQCSSQSDVIYANPTMPANAPTLRDTLVIQATYQPPNNGAPSIYWCTAELLNDTASDGAPLIITAGHCLNTEPGSATLLGPGQSYPITTYWEVDNQDAASGHPSIYGFGPGAPEVYDPSGPGGYYPAQQTSVTAYAPYRQYTAKILAVYSDGALLELNAPPPPGAHYSAWNAATLKAGMALSNTNNSWESQYGDPGGDPNGVYQSQTATATETTPASPQSAPGGFVTDPPSQGGGTYPLGIGDVTLQSGALSFGASGSGFYDNTGALRSIARDLGDYCQIGTVEMANLYAGDGTPTGSFHYWLDPSGSGATSAPGMDSPADSPAPPLQVPGQAPASGGGGGNPAPGNGGNNPTPSGGGAFGWISLAGLGVLGAIRRRRSTRRG